MNMKTDISSLRIGPSRVILLSKFFLNPLFLVGIFYFFYFSSPMFRLFLLNLFSFSKFVQDGLIWFYNLFNFPFSFVLGLVLVIFAFLYSYIFYKSRSYILKNEEYLYARTGLFNAGNLFQNFEDTKTLNMIIDVDINQSIIQLIFGIGDCLISTANDSPIVLQNVRKPSDVRNLILSKSNVKNARIYGSI